MSKKLQTGFIHSLANKIGLTAVIIVLLAAYMMQFSYSDLPCPLCLLQRVCFIAVGIALSMNLRHGPRPAYYGLAILSAAIGFSISVRQVLLHIKPGDPGYGTPFLGIHLYTWAAIAFFAFVLALAIALLFNFGDSTRKDKKHYCSRCVNILLIIFTLLILANVVSTFLECGPYQCPDNPISYWFFNR